MYLIKWRYDYGTWKEARASNMLATEEEVKRYLDVIKSKSFPAINIRVTQFVDVTDKFIPA